MRSKLLKGVVVFLLVLCTAHFAFAQADTARLQGTITDQDNAVVPGALVTVTNLGTGQVSLANASELGYYTVPGLTPGSYRVEVTQKGFKKSVRELELQVAQIGVADFRLEIGAASESVVVEAGSPVINPGDSAIGDVVESRQITELPLNGRNFTQLATLVPGVTRGVPTAAATGANGNAETFRDGETGGAALAVNGLRPQNNNFTLDGIDNNEALVNTIVFFPNADAIDEFRVQTSVAPAQFGRAGGALVQTSIKQGSNAFHGSAYWFNRNTDLQARDYFDNGPTPKYNRNQFGGTLGGPILKDKLFFFVDYQGLRKKIPGSNDVATVPTAKMRTGDFSELLAGAGPSNDPTGLSGPITVLDPTTGLPFAGNIIPTDRLNSAGLAYLNAFPAPNCDATIDTRCHTIYQNYHNIRKINENWDDFDVRVDWIVNSTNTIFGRLSRGHVDQTQTTRLTTLPSGFGSGTNYNYPWGAAIGWNDTISPTILNEARIGFIRTTYGYNPPFNGTDLCVQLGIVNCNTPLLGGIALIGGYNNQIEYTGDYGTYKIPQTGYQASDIVTWTHGKHTFKAGGNFIKRELNLYRPLAGKGYFFLAGNGTAGHINTGYEVSDLLAGFTENYSHGTSFGMVGTRSWENGLFLMDDWRVTQRLTLNLGLRYDILTWPYEVLDRQANFDIPTGQLVLPNQTIVYPSGQQVTYPRELVNNNWNNWAPRLGFAYQLTSDGKTVLRGGVGIFYFLDRGGIDNQLAQNAPFGGQNSAGYNQGYRITFTGALACQPNCTAADLISPNATGSLPSGDFTNLDLANPSGVSVISFLRKNATPNTWQWNLQLQRQIGNSSSVSLAYVGTKGTHLTRNYNSNQHLYDVSNSDPDRQLYTQLGNITTQDNSGNSNYNSLQAQYERRFRAGLQLLAGFDWSKAIDDSCGNLDTCAPQLYTNYKLERGLANIDQNYRLVVSGIYQLPWGRGMRWGSNWSRPLDWVLGGWQINGIYSLQSGLPFSVTVQGTPGSTRADLTGSKSVNPGSLDAYMSASNYALPAATLFNGSDIVFNAPGTAGRDILRGPGSSNIDMSIFKVFHITERTGLEFRFQAYNATNTPHFNNPNGNLGYWSKGKDENGNPILVPNINSNFGRITSTLPFSYRQCELGLRLTF